MRKESIWMKQVRPLKELWGKRAHAGTYHKTLVISNGVTLEGGSGVAVWRYIRLGCGAQKEQAINFAGHPMTPRSATLKTWPERPRSAGNYVGREVFLEYKILAQKAVADA